MFWGRLGKISNGVGTLQFHTLSAFMGSLLCLPHANVDVERVFICKSNKNKNEKQAAHKNSGSIIEGEMRRCQGRRLYEL